MRFFRLLVFCGLCATAATPALAMSYCAKHDALAQILDSKFGEHQQGMGLAGQEALVELFVSKKGTFTLVSTNKDGVSCIVGAGDNWEKSESKDMAEAM